MSNAWEGYYEGRRQKRGRRWRFVALALVLAVGALVGVGRCLPQGNPFAPRQANVDPKANPAETAVVVYNASDPLSRDLAQYYAEKRGVPAAQVVGLKCSSDEEISRQEYDDTVAGPLRGMFDAQGWWQRTPDRPGQEPASTVTSNRMHYLVLMRGVPLRIKQTSGYPGDSSKEPSPLRDANGASVDSELAVLGLFTHIISGFLPNPYFHSYGHFPDARCPPGLMLVARLDAPTGATVRRMIDDSLAVEKTGLWGRCYLDRRGMTPESGPLAEGDGWLTKILTETAPFLLPTVDDNRQAMYSASYPMTGAALYFGWYAENVAGPFTQAHFHFQPGAVACHIHSFSATSVRDPFRWWVGPLLDKGAAAVLGNVYEPYLSLTTHLDLFADRLSEGYNLAESAYAAQPGLSWMNTVVGDPLYRPGLVWKNLESDLSDGAPSSDTAAVAEGKAYWRGAQVWHARGAAAGAAALEKSGERLHSGLICEGLGWLQSRKGDAPRALAAFDRAARYYKVPEDVIRVVLQQARVLASTGKKAEALNLLKASREKYASVPAAAALEEIQGEVTSPF